MTQSTTELRYEIVPDGAPEPLPETPLHLLHRGLRGRSRLAIVAAAVLAGLGGVIGYHAKPAKYVSQGLVRIDAERSPILYESRENQTPPMFDALVSAHEQMLQSRMILDAALARPEMRDAGWPAAPEGIAEVRRGLLVRRGRRENLITVSVAHPDPAMAKAAVNAILSECERSPPAATSGLSHAEKERMLSAREHDLEQDLHVLRTEILERSNQYGAEGIARMHATRLDELLALDRLLAGLRSRSAPGTGLVAPGGGAEGDELRAREVELLATRDALGKKFRPRHVIMVELDRQIAVIEAQRRRLAGVGDDGEVPAPAELERRIEDSRAARIDLLAELDALGALRVAVAALTDRAEAITEQLHTTRRRIDELRLEARAGKPNRITIAAWGEHPVTPTYDHRSGLAAGGALFGVALGVGIVFLLGLIDRRVRFADELVGVHPDVDVIGVLPDLHEHGQAGPPRASAVVNQVRNLLELGGDTRRTHAVTSCARGAGRTSFTLALGSSFATAGRRTLIIDADLARASLSREVALRDDPPGHLDQPASKWRICRTRQDGLHVLPADALAPTGGNDLSRSMLLELLEAVGPEFDTIIIDCGPVDESVEACLVAGIADRVILMVSRHRRLALVRSALTRLEQFGASVEGLVFNRAGTEDVATSHAAEHAGIRTPFVPAFRTPADNTLSFPLPAPEPEPDADPERRHAA